jgi:hypothetical protein
MPKDHGWRKSLAPSRQKDSSVPPALHPCVTIRSRFINWREQDALRTRAANAPFNITCCYFDGATSA